MVGYITLGTNDLERAARFSDENAATVGNGVMIAFNGGIPTNVSKLYANALELGAIDEGHPHRSSVS